MADGYEGNIEDDGAHACVGEKPLPGAPALRALELRRMGFFFVGIVPKRANSACFGLTLGKILPATP